MRLTENFTEKEFECPDCQKQIMDSMFMWRLQEARTLAGIPFRINSGWRCKAHNEAVGGTPNSSHLKGLAADIRCRVSRTRFLILYALMDVGFNRIGVADDFIHVDIDPDKTNDVIWVYAIR